MHFVHKLPVVCKYAHMYTHWELQFYHINLVLFSDFSELANDSGSHTPTLAFEEEVILVVFTHGCRLWGEEGGRNGRVWW